MGPPPKPADQRARRNASPAMTQLPKSGRPGRAPAWPLGPDFAIELAIEENARLVAAADAELADATTAKERGAAKSRRTKAERALAHARAMKKLQSGQEKKLWAALWKTPQATQWEKRGWYREVALYVRHQVKAEAGSLDDSKEARQREDRLGLNDLAMLRLRWEIVDTSATATGPRRQSKRNSSKYRDLKVVS
ncbi:hypothetical protein QWY28_17305 [Nocardioides sp. SOB77]|uniref:DUF222 domain-containing protein n=1 Tax=Nocardioides oceani TaxID=3058369 RepID=A0ABT8FK31_9ACTN|nr:hypothetical protein [Nocardioides oceani]MDN4174722.1 hypothetical protein [Nocardioides oceani]